MPERDLESSPPTEQPQEKSDVSSRSERPELAGSTSDMKSDVIDNTPSGVESGSGAHQGERPELGTNQPDAAGPPERAGDSSGQTPETSKEHTTSTDRQHPGPGAGDIDPGFSITGPDTGDIDPGFFNTGPAMTDSAGEGEQPTSEAPQEEPNVSSQTERPELAGSNPENRADKAGAEAARPELGASAHQGERPTLDTPLASTADPVDGVSTPTPETPGASDKPDPSAGRPENQLDRSSSDEQATAAQSSEESKGKPEGTASSAESPKELARNPANSYELSKGDIPPKQAVTIVDSEGKNVIVLPEITIHGVPPGSRSRSGEGFKTPEGAASAALSEIDTKSTDAKSEFAGNIYQRSDGSYSFSPPAKGTDSSSNPKDSKVPGDAKIVGTYHSHGGAFEASDEIFSPADKGKATLGKQESYLVTPRGDMYKYTPVDLLPNEMQGKFPTGQVTKLN